MAKPLAVITGATGGIGQVLARRLARDGWCLHLIDLSAIALKALAEDFPSDTTWSESSLTTPDECKEALPPSGAFFDALVHLAGVFVPDDLDQKKRDIFEDAIQHNATNAYDLSVAAVPMLNDGGRVVFTASLAFNRGVADHPAYTMSKGAVVGLTRSLSRRLGTRGICVNALAPGIIETKMTTNLIAARGREKVEDSIPLQRLGQPEDISGVIAFLLSKDASYITGQVINVDGGIING